MWVNTYLHIRYSLLLSLLFLQIDANYDWEYAVKEHYNDFGHKESRNGYAATGKYYVALPDGKYNSLKTLLKNYLEIFRYNPQLKLEPAVQHMQVAKSYLKRVEQCWRHPLVYFTLNE